MSEWRKRAVEGVGEGDTFVVTRTFGKELARTFGEMTGDFNPVHFDQEFARLKGFGDNICHGLLAGSLVTLIGGQIAWLATKMEFSFLKPVPFGEKITCTLKVMSVDKRRFARAEARITNTEGVELVRCTLEGYLPSEKDRARLAEMHKSGDPTNKLHGRGKYDDQ